MSNKKTGQESTSTETNSELHNRGADFLEQVDSEAVPSGLRPDLDPEAPDDAGGDGGGVGKSI